MRENDEDTQVVELNSKWLLYFVLCKVSFSLFEFSFFYLACDWLTISSFYLLNGSPRAHVMTKTDIYSMDKPQPHLIRILANEVLETMTFDWY